MNQIRVHLHPFSHSTLSRPHMNYPSSPDIESPIDDDSSDESSLLPAPSSYQSLRFPRNYRILRRSANLGWLVSLSLFITLVLSHSTLAPPIQCFHLDSLKAFPKTFRIPYPYGNEQRYDPALQRLGANSTDDDVNPVRTHHHNKVQYNVTIASGFYRVDSGKKHRVDGKLARHF
jgi:hypothetical protein